MSALKCIVVFLLIIFTSCNNQKHSNTHYQDSTQISILKYQIDSLECELFDAKGKVEYINGKMVFIYDRDTTYFDSLIHL